MEQRDGSGSLRLAELLAALSLGIDLGFGQPMEHVLRQCRIALRLAELIDLSEEQRAGIYYAALIVNVGCHTDAHEQVRWFGDDIAMKSTKYAFEPFSRAQVMAMLRMIGGGGTPLHRVRVCFDFVRHGKHDMENSIAQHARMARALGAELDLSPVALDTLAASYERWDGRGWPGELSGSTIPIGSRVVQLAEFLEVAHREGGTDEAVALARRRAGSQFDPRLATVVADDCEKVFEGLDELGSWDQVIDADPALSTPLSPAQSDAALSAVATFVDLKSPYTLGRSLAVAELASRAGQRLGMEAKEVHGLYRAGLVHGFGRLGVSNAIWDKHGGLTAGEWERVRSYPYLTERMIHQSDALAPIGRVAALVQERLDGSGYPKGLRGTAIAQSGRVLAAAAAYQAMREPRPHRPAKSPQDAAGALRHDVRAGGFDADAVEAVLGAAGLRAARRRSGPAGLTAREVEILRLLVRGLSAKEIAERLVISVKTATNHIEHVYTKIQVSNRAAASLYALQHGLLPDEDFAD